VKVIYDIDHGDGDELECVMVSSVTVL